jgi:transcriptional regulator with GAF, ATPase, and Fis domain
MNSGNRYRIAILISYIVLVLCSVLLFISLWNNLSMNPDFHAGNSLYFLVFLIFALATLIFILHLFDRNHEGNQVPETDQGIVQDEVPAEPREESYTAPFEVDVDEIAESVVPRIDPKETVADFAERILFNLARHFEIAQGILYLKNNRSQEFKCVSTFACTTENGPPPFKTGDGLPGQVAKNKTILNLSVIPENYLQIESGLGKSPPKSLLIIPLLLNKETFGVIELALFKPVNKETEWTFRNLAKIIGNTLVTKTKSEKEK